MSCAVEATDSKNVSLKVVSVAPASRTKLRMPVLPPERSVLAVDFDHLVRCSRSPNWRCRQILFPLLNLCAAKKKMLELLGCFFLCVRAVGCA
jgi:hypothetical protein